MNKRLNFADENLLISILIPQDWEANKISPQNIRFAAKPQKSYNNYRPYLNILRKKPDGEGNIWFEEFCRENLDELEQNCTGFKYLYSDRSSLSSFADLHIAIYECSPEPQEIFTRLQAMIYHTKHNFYFIEASTPKPLADTFIPKFEQAIKSIRLLPERS